jgi:hypothetical protein
MKQRKLFCCVCRKELDKDSCFSFYGSFGCEQCIRDYYETRKDELELELRERKYVAEQMLRGLKYRGIEV